MPDAARPFRILFLCANNAGRSRMAEAIVRTRGEKRPAGVAEAMSAGIRPNASVSEYAVVVLQMYGIRGASRRETRALAAVEGESFDLVVTLCEESLKACPRFANTKAQVHWSIPDPMVSIAQATARANFSVCYAALVERINALLRLPLETLSPDELAAKAQAIHDGLTIPEYRSSSRLRRPTQGDWGPPR